MLFDNQDYCSSPSDFCVFSLPAYVRLGAIIPTMFVDYKTKNSFGERWGESPIEDLIVKVYTSSIVSGNFTLYEDDGVTFDYTKGIVRTTLLSHQVIPQTEDFNLTISLWTILLLLPSVELLELFWEPFHLEEIFYTFFWLIFRQVDCSPSISNIVSKYYLNYLKWLVSFEF